MLDKELVGEIARIARLEVTEEEKEKLLGEMKEILDTFEVLKHCDTENTETSIHPVKLRNHLREDKANDCLSQEQALSQTELKKDGYFMGPKAL